MPENIKLSKGDSCTIQVVVPTEIVADINEIVVSLGNNLFARLSDNTLIQVSNVFTWKIKSNLTKNLGQNLSVITAIDRDGYGNRKSKVETAPKISFLDNSNPESNISTSDFVDLTVSYTFTEEELIVSEVFMSVHKGYSALDLYRTEKNLPTATLDEMMAYYSGRTAISIVNIGDGAVITHNLGGHVLTKFVDSTGEILNNVRGEYLSDNTVTLRTPLLDDILNQTYTGKMICERY